MSVQSPPRQQAAGVALVLLCVSQFMLTLDATVVTVALPAMQHELGLAPAHLQWLSTAYTLLFGGFLILAGRAADLFGKRRMMVIGLVLFTLASLAAGLSQQTWDIIAARAVQGLGAAIVTPAALALLTTTFPEGPLRNKAMAYWGAVASAGAIGGYVLSGLIVDTIGWRWIFFVNIPIGVLSVLGVLKLFGADRPDKRTRLDLSGALTLTTAVVVIVYAMTTAGTGQFGGIELALLVGGFVLLGTFVLIEQRKPDPLVRFEILAGRSVLIGNVINVVNAATSMVILFFATLYLQEVLELTPLQAGLAFAPVTAVILVVSGRTAPLMARFGARPLLIAGSVASLVGVAWLTQISVDGSYLADVFPGLIFVGVGAALTFAPSMIVATSGVADEYQGLSTGLVSTSQQLGGAVGLAVFATIIAGRITAAGGDEAALTDAYGFGYVWALSLPVLAIVATALVPRKTAPQS